MATQAGVARRATVAQGDSGQEDGPREGVRFDIDDWYSALLSFVFHFCLGLILPLLAGALAAPDKLPVAVEMVEVVDTQDATGDQNDDLQGGDAAAAASTQSEEPVPQELMPTPEVGPVAPVDVPVIDRSALDSSNVSDVVDRSSDIVSNIREKLQQRLGGGGGDGGQGTAGSGDGSGGGRAGRAARWILHFNTASPVDYLNQIGGLGGEIAFPQAGNKFLYFTNLSDTPRSSQRDLANEDRIFWIDERPDSFLPVARHLNVPRPPLMLSFLPKALEQRLLDMELARASEKLRRQATEGDVAQTIFVVVRRGGEFDVQISEQRLR